MYVCQTLAYSKRAAPGGGASVLFFFNIPKSPRHKPRTQAPPYIHTLGGPDARLAVRIHTYPQPHSSASYTPTGPGLELSRNKPPAKTAQKMSALPHVESRSVAARGGGRRPAASAIMAESAGRPRRSGRLRTYIHTPPASAGRLLTPYIHTPSALCRGDLCMLKKNKTQAALYCTGILLYYLRCLEHYQWLAMYL